MTAPTATHTRESWLRAAVEVFRPRFDEIGFPLPSDIHISVGFAHGARAENGKILGQCWKRAASKDGINHIFVSPESGDTVEVLETVLHELIHAALDCEDGHRGRFAEAATRLGFMGPMTATPSSVELAAELMTIAATLGNYPHGELMVPDRKTTMVTTVPAQGGSSASPVPVKWHSGAAPQTGRMLKMSCKAEGCECTIVAKNGKTKSYTIRTTAEWIAVGNPRCPYGGEMTQD